MEQATTTITSEITGYITSEITGATGVAYTPTYTSSQTSTDGLSVIITLYEPTYIPILPALAVTGFTVTVNGTDRPVTVAVRSGNTEITLTVASVISQGDTILLTYAPGNVTNGNATPLLAFGPRSVTNNSTVFTGSYLLLETLLDKFLLEDSSGSIILEA